MITDHNIEKVRKALRKKAYELYGQLYEKDKKPEEIKTLLKDLLKTSLPGEIRKINTPSWGTNQGRQNPQGPQVRQVPTQSSNDLSFLEVLGIVLGLDKIIKIIRGNDGNNVNINVNTGPNAGNGGGQKNEEGAVAATFGAFFLIAFIIGSFVGLAFSIYKIKELGLENNKYTVPTAVVLGIITLSAAIAITLLVTGIIKPNLQSEIGLTDGRFMALQIGLAIVAAVFFVEAIAFGYLAVSKSNEKSSVDKLVDSVIRAYKEEQIPRTGQGGDAPGTGVCGARACGHGDDISKGWI